jgi:hypothetical protein
MDVRFGIKNPSTRGAQDAIERPRDRLRRTNLPMQTLIVSSYQWISALVQLKDPDSTAVFVFLEHRPIRSGHDQNELMVALGCEKTVDQAEGERMHSAPISWRDAQAIKPDAHRVTGRRSSSGRG